MWMDEVAQKKKRGNRILFSKDSLFLQDLRMLLEGRNRRVMVLWALDLAEQTVERLEESCPTDPRPRFALEAARAWARGRIKMPVAQRAILDCHAMAKELTAPADIARCHAVAQACSVVHTPGHALGYPMYELTAIVLEQSPDTCRAAVESRMDAYMEKLLFWMEQEPVYSGEWAEFLKREPEGRGWPREKEEDATCCPPSPAGAPGSFPRTGRSPRSGSEKSC